VRPDRLGDPGPAGHSPNNPSGPVTVKTLVPRSGEDWSLGSFSDGQVDRSGGPRRERDGDDLASFAHNGQGAVSSHEAERFDVGSGRF
jgi:hypothetical protein